MKPVIYYRGIDFEKYELEYAKKYFKCVNSILDLEKDDLVIARYSLYPFYKDQEKDITRIGAKLINPLYQHSYVADLQNYVYDLKELTFATWDNLQNIPNNCSFVLKGETNSKKQNWSRMMFAQDKERAIQVYNSLSEDGLIGDQKIYIRRYERLKTYLVGIGGIPITKEFRFFVCNGKIVCGAYYWQNYEEDIELPSIEEVPKEFLKKAIGRVKDKINFFALDVAQKENNDWVVVEINDGCQSGLSCNDPEIFYKRLKECI